MEAELKLLPRCFVQDPRAQAGAGPVSLKLRTLEMPLRCMLERIDDDDEKLQGIDLVPLFADVHVELIHVRVFRLLVDGSKPSKRPFRTLLSRPRDDGVVRLDIDINEVVLAKAKKGDLLFECASNRVYAADPKAEKLVPMYRPRADMTVLKPNARCPPLDYLAVATGLHKWKEQRCVFLPTNLTTKFSIGSPNPWSDYRIVRDMYLRRCKELSGKREKAMKRMREEEGVEWDTYVKLRRIAEEEDVGNDLGVDN